MSIVLDVLYSLKKSKLPTEWKQMFRILLSIYIAWLVLFSPKKPIIKESFGIRLLFIILLFLFIQTDFVSAILLLMIYFLSFQSVLPINDEYTKIIQKEGFESVTPKPTTTTTQTPVNTMSQAAKDSEFEKKITSNLTGTLEVTPPPKPMVKMDLAYGSDEALGTAVTPSADILEKINNIQLLTPDELLELLKKIRPYPQFVKVELLSKIPALKIITNQQRLELVNKLEKLTPEEQFKMIQPYITNKS
jgi:hypothetical protein